MITRPNTTKALMRIQTAGDKKEKMEKPTEQILTLALMEIVHEANNLILVEQLRGGNYGNKIKVIAEKALIETGVI